MPDEIKRWKMIATKASIKLQKIESNLDRIVDILPQIQQIPHAKIDGPREIIKEIVRIKDIIREASDE